MTTTMTMTMTMTMTATTTATTTTTATATAKAATMPSVGAWDPGPAVAAWSGAGWSGAGWSGAADSAQFEQAAGAARRAAASVRSCSSAVGMARCATDGRWLGPGPDQLRDAVARWCGDAIDEAARLDALATRLEESAALTRVLEQERLEQERLEQERLEQERLEQALPAQEPGGQDPRDQEAAARA